MRKRDIEKQRDQTHQEALDHAEWFVQIIKPLLVSWFEHGHKHGRDSMEGDLKCRSTITNVPLAGSDKRILSQMQKTLESSPAQDVGTG